MVVSLISINNGVGVLEELIYVNILCNRTAHVDRGNVG